MLKTAPDYVGALAIDPTVSTTLYAGADSGVLKSTDGGATWPPMKYRPDGTHWAKSQRHRTGN
jgi:hypothetical protein